MLGYLLRLPSRDIKHACRIVRASREDFISLLTWRSDDGKTEIERITRLVPANIQDGSLVRVQRLALCLSICAYFVYTNLILSMS